MNQKAYKDRAFTLIELIIIVISIGILASIALPQFSRMKENALNNEAKVNLSLIQAAQKIYKMEIGSYYTSSSIPAINENLKLSLPAGSNQNWDYTTNSSGTGTAPRYPSTTRTWTLAITGEEPTCSGIGCP